MFKKLSVLLALLVVLGFTVPASAITFNYVKDFEHPFVGMAVFYDQNGVFVSRCSGSLLSPTIFLTAGHCVYNAGGPNDLFVKAWIYFQQDAGANYDSTTKLDPITGYPKYCAVGTEGVACATSDTLYNFGFEGVWDLNLARTPNSKDIGLMILDQPIALPEYGQLASVGFLDKLATKRGLQDVTFNSSGYGYSFTNPSNTVSFRTRLMAKSQLQNLRNALAGGYNVQVTNSAGIGGGTCYGDSGGPLFYGDYASNLIVGVTSYGHSQYTCAGADLFYRTDRQAVLDWIRAHVPNPNEIQIADK